MWYLALNDKLVNESDYTQRPSDPCMYVKRTDSDVVYFSVHVDDMLIAAKDIAVLNHKKARLSAWILLSSSV